MAGIVRRVAGTGLVALALGVGGAGEAGAQDFRLPDTGFLGMGVAGVGTSELDDRLAESGYPTFGSTAAAPSLSVSWTLSSGVMLGGEWAGFVFGEEQHAGGEVGLGGGYGTVGIGYAVDLSSRARVYPRIGIGGGGMGLWIEDEPVEQVGFDEVLADPIGQPTSSEEGTILSRGDLVVDLGAGFEFLPGGRGRGPLIGLRFGYLAAPTGSDWKLEGDYTDGDPVSGGPSATIAGPYVRVVVGVGRRR